MMDSIERDLVEALERIGEIIDPDTMAEDTNVDHIRHINRIRKIVGRALEMADHHARLAAMGAFNDE